MSAELLYRLRERYGNSHESSRCASIHSITSEELPRPPLSSLQHSSAPPCAHCHSLLVELHLLRKSKAEDRCTIDHLAAKLEWEHVHAWRHHVSRPAETTVAPTTVHYEIQSPCFKHHMERGNSTGHETSAVMSPSGLMMAYRSLQEVYKCAKEEWLQQRCRYEGQIAEMRERLLHLENQCNDSSEVSTSLGKRENSSLSVAFYPSTHRTYS